MWTPMLLVLASYVVRFVDPSLNDKMYSRELLVDEYLDSFVSQVETFPSTIMLFRDQTHLGLTADILRNS